MINDLTPQMQERLDRWMKNTLPVKSADIFRRKYVTNRPVNRDYGDDIRDYEMKQQSMWNNQNIGDVMKDDYE